MKLRISIAALLCLTGSAVSAQELDLSMSNDTALVRYAMPVSYSGYGQTDGTFGLLYTESDDFMGSAGLEMMGEAGSHAPGLNGGVSIKAYAVSLSGGYDVASLTLGGKAWYVPPTLARLGVVGQLNFGPDVTTFGDAERFWDFTMRAEYEVLPEAAIYVGYRNLKVRLEPSSTSVNLDKGWHVGLRLSF